MSVLEGAGLGTWAWIGYIIVSSLVLFVAAVLILGKMVKRHTEDKQAKAKMSLGLLAGLVLGGLAFGGLVMVQQHAVEGMHASFTKELSTAVGEADYLAAVNATEVKPKNMDTQRGIMETRNATLAGMTPGTPEYAKEKGERDAVWAAFNITKKDLETAHTQVALLTANHAAWQKVAPIVAAGDLEGARHMLEEMLNPATITNHLPLNVACAREKTGACASPLVAAPLIHDYKDSHLKSLTIAEGIEESYHVHHASLVQMETQLLIFGYPSVTGMLLAGVAFAGGSILRRTFVPSDSVGFKPYPGKSIGLFLGFGAFGILAAPFGAWMLWDLSRRSSEGQIAL